MAALVLFKPRDRVHAVPLFLTARSVFLAPGVPTNNCSHPSAYPVQDTILSREQFLRNDPYGRSENDLKFSLLRKCVGWPKAT